MLRALMRQDYDDFEITFIVESTDDPACRVIHRVMAEHPWVPGRVVIAGRAAAISRIVDKHGRRPARLGRGRSGGYAGGRRGDSRAHQGPTPAPPGPV